MEINVSQNNKPDGTDIKMVLQMPDLSEENLNHGDALPQHHNDCSDGNETPSQLDHLNMDSISLSDVAGDGKIIQDHHPTDSEMSSSFLLERLQQLKDENLKLQQKVDDNQKAADKWKLEYTTMMEELNRKEVEHTSVLAEQEKKFTKASEEMAYKNSELKKHYIAANKEKESMVMKYAMGEKEIIIQRKAREEAEKKLQTVTKERDEASTKLKALIAEKNRVQQLGDARYQDIVVLKKEVDKWKEEFKIQETKASVASGRHKSEVEAHAVTRQNLEATIKQLSETRQEIEKTRIECQEFMKKLKDDEEGRKKKFETAAKEERVKLMIDEAAASELEALKVKYKAVVEENNNFSVKIQKFEKDRLEYDANLSKLKETVTSQKQEIVDLMALVAEMESLRMQLQREEERSEERSAEVDRLRGEAADLLADMAACRRKEADLLEFTQKLTDKNVTLQSDLACLESKASSLENEHRRLTSKLSECEKKLASTESELETEKKRRKEETELLAKKLAELSKQVEISNQKMTDAENEVLVLKRKHAASLRELTRELQSCKRQLDENTELSTRNHQTSPMSESSRTSSNTSLNRASSNGDENSNDFPKSPLSQTNIQCNGLTESAGEHTYELTTQVPNSHVLVEKIVNLQRTLARKQEKIDFMEDHVTTMVEEMKKKNRLLQQYILQEESGALSSSSMDENKARTSAHGGIMASLYSSKPSDSAMTLELSLEINQKLQAVLEDTLLKNMTLKENINTLGKEIASLSTRHSIRK